MAVGEFLFGVSAKQPGDHRKLVKMREQIYSPCAELKTSIIRSAEPIRFADLDHQAFRTLKPGTVWGRKFDCAWLHITGTIPEGVASPLIQVGIRGEGLIYSPTGEVLSSISTVWAQGDLPHPEGGFRQIGNLDLSSGKIDFYVDAGFNGLLFYGMGNALFHGARIVTCNEEAKRLYYDYMTLMVLQGATDDHDLAKQLRRDLDLAYAKFSARDFSGARRFLVPHLAQPSTSDFVYTGVGHGHLDMAWLWPLRETRRKAARTYARALTMIEQRPNYIYGTSQPQQLQWMQQEQPELFARIKEAIARGRIEPQGAFWVEPDTNLPSGESLVRQSIVGRRFWEEEIGIPAEQMRLCWLPDTFGYNGNLPQILKKSGMDWFMTIKLAWNKVNTFPHRTFNWEGIDGSQVLVHMPPEGDYNSRAAADGLLRGLAQYPEKELDTALLVYGSGDGGGGPGEIHMELLEREQDLAALPRIELGTASDFFRQLEQQEIAHTHIGELYLETHQGTYTTQAAMKRGNRRMERMLHNAEALAVLVGEDSRERLREPWQQVLLHQFHDIIPGSSITRVHEEARQTYRELTATLGDYTDELVDSSPSGSEGPAAINLTSFPRREYIRHDDQWYQADLAPYSAATLEPAQSAGHLSCSDETLSNGIVTLRFGKSGEIISCTDAAGVEHADEGLNRLVLHRDPYQFPFDAWDIDQQYYRRKPKTLTPSEVWTFIDGPTVVRCQTYAFGKSRVVQQIILELNSSLVRFDTRVDWHESHRMLRAEFRPTHFGPEARCEIQFGHIARPTTQKDSVEQAQFEVCAHKWLATENAQGGFALVNDSKYGHRAKDGLISLNLLRAPTFPDKTADRGSHHFCYGFLPFESGNLQPVIEAGYRLNNPLLVATGVSFDSMVATGDPGVVVETVKISEDGASTVLRLYEALGRETTTSVVTSLATGRAFDADLLERKGGELDLTAVPFGPFEIKTIVLERA